MSDDEQTLDKHDVSTRPSHKKGGPADEASDRSIGASGMSDTAEAVFASQAVEEQLPKNTAAAVDFLRQKLLDIGKRNRLINTPLKSSRAKQLRIFDELSDEVFQILVGDGKQMSFLPVARSEEGAEDDTGEEVYVPPPDDDVGEDGIASRHTDLFLQTNYKPEPLQKRLLGLSRDAKTLEEEQGVSVLFLALGFLKWFESDSSDVERYAPLIVLPVNLIRDDVRGRFKLALREEDLQVNLSLQAMLESDFGLSLPDLPEEEGWKPSEYFEKVTDLVSNKNKWTVEADEIVLGFYSFAKFLMWRDLDPKNWPDGKGIAGNGLLDKLLVDGFEIEEKVISEDQNLDEAFPDPAELGHIMDADASQAQVIAAARAGKNLAVQGPPGTGKSQTIANIIATAVADEKRVLFVAEKLTALTVVHDRLVDCGLADICLELHSHKANKKALLEELDRTLKAGRPRAADTAAYKEVREYRDELNKLSTLLHERDSQSERSPFEVISELVKLKEDGAETPSFELPDTAQWSRNQVSAGVVDASAFSEAIEQSGKVTEHPWRGVTKRLSPMDRDRLREEIEAATGAAVTLSDLAREAAKLCGWEAPLTATSCDRLVACLEALDAMPEEAPVLTGNAEALDDLDRVEALCETIFDHRSQTAALSAKVIDSAFDMDWAEVRGTIAGHGNSILRFLNGNYRAAVEKLKSVSKTTLSNVQAERLSLLDALIAQKKSSERLGRESAFGSLVFSSKWRQEETEQSGVAKSVKWLRKYQERFDGASALAEVANAAAARSELPNDRELAGVLRAWQDAVRVVLARLGLDLKVAFNAAEQDEIVLDDFRSRFDEWLSDPEGIVTWFHVSQAEERCRQKGLGELCDRVNSGQLSPDCVVGQFKYAWAEALWKRLIDKRIELNDIDGSKRHEIVSKFRRLDDNLKELAAQEVALAHHQRMPKGGAGAMGVVRSEIAKRRRHMPVRKLMDLAGDAIAQLKPVFMMSPLSVSQYLKPGNLRFDLLVIDEASQVKPEDALGAIVRADQIIVVGDQKQLPPTSFFDRSMAGGDDAEQYDDELDSEEALARIAAQQVSSMESVLSLCHARDMHGDILRWHYRSQHPSLIEVSNHQFYDDRLIYPPSPTHEARDIGMIFEKVDGVYDRGRTRQNQIEAKAIAEAVIRHAREHANLSLGVATFSTNQRDAILNSLEFLRSENPELEAFFSENKRERFFVKSLENVQGDERDVIFVSVGYGRDGNGYMTQGFGPVTQEGGERRLNVLFTRAKRICRVFSSITYNDIRLDGDVPPGRKALARFLKYAELGDLDIPQITGQGTDSPFEDAVAAALVRHGYEVATQVGSAGFRIDLAISDPKRKGHFALGIECDGATYHSSRWARERDRLRQTVLEAKGWRIHRIWSTDWFEQPEKELNRLLAAVEDSLAGSSGVAASNSPEKEKVQIERELVHEPEPMERQVYKQADFVPPGSNSQPLHEVSAGVLASSIQKIVEAEAPIHQEEVARRLSSLWGYNRTGARIQAAVARGVGLLLRERKLETCPFEPSDVLDTARSAYDLPACRDRSNVESATLRKPKYIPLIEIASGLVQVVDLNAAIDDDDAAREVARMLGFKSTSQDFRDRYTEARDIAADESYLIFEAGALRSSPQDPRKIEN